MTNNADPDQLAYKEANWSESTLFVYVGHTRVQQDQGWSVFTDGWESLVNTVYHMDRELWMSVVLQKHLHNREVCERDDFICFCTVISNFFKYAHSNLDRWLKTSYEPQVGTCTLHMR